MSKKKTNVETTASTDVVVKGNKTPKVFISLEEVTTIEHVLINLENEVSKLPESTFKRSFETHFKYMNKNILARKQAAAQKVIIRGIREGRIDITTLYNKEE